MADKRISQLIERVDIANNDVLPIVASGATTTNKVTISTLQTWMQGNLDVGVTSVGLTMPSAFSVAGSPVTSSGNITVTAAGTASQYIRGDGTLADFPTGGGGGSSVSYYLNGSVSQGTIGGVAYLEMNKTPILGAGTDFNIAADGYIASFVTDAGDPGLLEIPAGNWNFESYFQASSSGGTPSFYIELYKISGATATLIASNSATPELIAFGTTINPYFSALAVPQTSLLITDRLAIRYYVNHSGRTITLHTENNTLCQIITTFTTGLTALNGLTAKVQNFAVGTSGTDFNISSSESIHNFNLPTASATNRGALSSADWIEFNSKEPSLPEGSYVFLPNIGAVGDGVNNDTLTIQNALDNYNIIDGAGLTYRIESTLIGKANQCIKNATFLAYLGANSNAIFFEGTQNSAISLTINVFSGDSSIIVPDGSLFSVDQWVYLSSTEDFAIDSKNGELVRIKSISSNTLYLYGEILLNYQVFYSASILPINMMQKIILENVSIIGANINGNRTGLRFKNCHEVYISNINTEQFQYSHVVFDRCAMVELSSGFASKTGTSIGLNYGVAIINACHSVNIKGYHGDSMRHVTTIGGSQGVSRFIKVSNCHGLNITDAGIDAHSSVHEHIFDSNTIHFATESSGNMDGIISQGSAPIITNNQLFGAKRHGIFWQPLQKNTFTGGVFGIIDTNYCYLIDNTGTNSGILVSTQTSGSNCAEIDNLIINNFQGFGYQNNIQIISNLAKVKNVDIVNCSTIKPVRGRSVFLNANENPIEGISILGGHHETDINSTLPIIEFKGLSDVLIRNWKVTATTLKRLNAGIGIRSNFSTIGIETGNVYDNVSTKTLIQNSTNVLLDPRGDINNITQTSLYAGVFNTNPLHAWDVGGSVNIPYDFAYRINGERGFQKSSTSKDIFLGQVDAISGETGRVILRARGQNSIFIIDGSNIGFGTAPSGANYDFNGTLRIRNTATFNNTLTGTSALLNNTTNQLTLQNVNGAANAERIGMFMGDNNIFKFLSLNDNNTTRIDNIITINNTNGNVGIGKSPSDAKLDVNGTVNFDLASIPLGDPVIAGRIYRNASFQLFISSGV